jgi:hypothetical protein
MADGIDGVPEDMMQYKPEAQALPTGGTTQTYNNLQSLKSDMPEGQAYAKQDDFATGELAQFVRKMNRGFEAYHDRASLDGYNYFNADEAGAAAIMDILHAGEGNPIA